MTEKMTEEKNGEEKNGIQKDEFGLNRSVFAPRSDSDFLKLKDKDKVEISIPKGGIRQERKQFKKFENGTPVKDAQGNVVIERVGDILLLDVEKINGQATTKKWEVTSKKLVNIIFSYLDKREKDGTPYLFSRYFQLERIGSGRETNYNLFPTEKKEDGAEKKVIKMNTKTGTILL